VYTGLMFVFALVLVCDFVEKIANDAERK